MMCIFDTGNLLPVCTEKLKIGAKTLFLNIFPFRIERVTTSMIYIEQFKTTYHFQCLSSLHSALQSILPMAKFQLEITNDLAACGSTLSLSVG